MLPCGVLIMAVAIGAAALFADAEILWWDSAVLPWSAKAEGLPLVEPRTALGPHAEELARRFGVRDRLARIIYEQARQAGVEPAMAFGMIAEESGFDPAAVGRQGERGLMQIKPSTARAYDARITPEALHMPEINVRLGLRHLKREVEYFGDPILGLMSYHRGRARLEREMADGMVPRDGYVERVLSSCGRDCA
ncbi:MAG TPA: transglycosylase SLT domain-containing protein [Gemmatimonadota bacterium]|nr:transglycosylase SLT domain-containing protein [Gemmatimonadota bacterium]